MSLLSFKTASIKPFQVAQKFVLVDAKSLTVGRLASQIAFLLRGKDKPFYTPHVVCGDKVIVINASQVVFTGNKEDRKIYQHYTGYPGGQRETTPRKMRSKFPCRVLEKAVKGMLPKTKLGRELFRNLFVYAGGEHPHQAQQPVTITIS